MILGLQIQAVVLPKACGKIINNAIRSMIMILTQLLDRLCKCSTKPDADTVEVSIYNIRQGIYYNIKNIVITDTKDIEIEVV